MSVESDFHALLAAHAGLAARIGDNVAQNGVQEGVPPPYVVYTVAHDPTVGLDGTVHCDQVTLTVECWAESAARADEVADQVEAALIGAPLAACASITARASGFDGDLGLDATVLTVEWWA